MSKIQFFDGQFYHVYNRGTDKRIIFHDPSDYFRFIKGLYEFNDKANVSNLHRSVRGPTSNIDKERDLLVDIIAWCLMPNHFHLVLRQRQPNGISLFLQKIGVGYTMYFNKRYERNGVLFQGETKAKHIAGDSYLTHAVRYVHLNPVAIIEPGWDDIGIKDWSSALDFLKNYKWSSHLDYLSMANFPEIINKEFLPGYTELNKDYTEFLVMWLKKTGITTFVRGRTSNKVIMHA